MDVLGGGPWTCKGGGGRWTCKRVGVDGRVKGGGSMDM